MHINPTELFVRFYFKDFVTSVTLSLYGIAALMFYLFAKMPQTEVLQYHTR